ncbi:phage portal protein [Mycolicibacterium palauense]|uniref:phage portal protein n=1 Tax=Mycolicibacterium palauense TaxID=2034511 RepID=UPI000BFEF603|nr:phage portal protein [Mycolicibacterium palauense]
MSNELVIELCQALDAPQHKFAQYGRYYRGEQALSFVSPESAAAIGNRLSKLIVNVPRIAVNAVAERCRLLGFEPDPQVWADFIANDLDQQAGIVHRSALLYGQSFVIVWSEDGASPVATVESPLNVQVLTDPATREVTSAVKRWTDATKRETHCVVYLPDEIQHWRANQTGAPSTALRLVGRLDNPLGVVPVVRFLNADLLGECVSEIADIACLTDALSKVSSDMLIASEFLAKPRRWATGVELMEVPVLDGEGNPVFENGAPVTEAVSPFPNNDKFLISEAEETKFGQLNGSTLDGYKNAADLILSELAAVSNLPPHYLGILHANPTSADSLRASEAGLTSKAEAKQAAFGRSWELVGKLMQAIRTGVSPASVQCRVQWCDPSTRSEAQAADAVLKLVQAGILSKSGALRRLGYTQTDIDQELSDRAADALASADPSLMTFAKLQNENGNMSYSGGI